MQFAVGRNKAAQVFRKQFPLCPAAAKTIHRSQGDIEAKIVVNFNTRRTHSLCRTEYVELLLLKGYILLTSVKTKLLSILILR